MPWYELTAWLAVAWMNRLSLLFESSSYRSIELYSVVAFTMRTSPSLAASLPQPFRKGRVSATASAAQVFIDMTSPLGFRASSRDGDREGATVPVALFGFVARTCP